MINNNFDKTNVLFSGKQNFTKGGKKLFDLFSQRQIKAFNTFFSTIEHDVFIKNPIDDELVIKTQINNKKRTLICDSMETLKQFAPKTLTSMTKRRYESELAMSKTVNLKHNFKEAFKGVFDFFKDTAAL